MTENGVSSQLTQVQPTRTSMLWRLTLDCCSLLRCFALDSQLLLAVATQSAKGQLSGGRRLHGRQQLSVADRAMLAVGGEDGSAYVLLHLSAVELARSARSLLLLQ